jgi:hypothetical protein
MQLDVLSEELWPFDLIIIRDLLFHFTPQQALAVLSTVNRSGARYVLTSKHPEERNKRSLRTYRAGMGFQGFWQINLQDAPFHLPPPLLAIGMDGQEWSFARSQRVMGLWPLPFDS